MKKVMKHKAWEAKARASERGDFSEDSWITTKEAEAFGITIPQVHTAVIAKKIGTLRGDPSNQFDMLVKKQHVINVAKELKDKQELIEQMKRPVAKAVVLQMPAPPQPEQLSLKEDNNSNEQDSHSIILAHLSKQPSTPQYDMPLDISRDGSRIVINDRTQAVVMIEYIEKNSLETFYKVFAKGCTAGLAKYQKLTDNQYNMLLEFYVTELFENNPGLKMDERYTPMYNYVKNQKSYRMSKVMNKKKIEK
jgi:hypothetical protein